MVKYNFSTDLQKKISQKNLHKRQMIENTARASCQIKINFSLSFKP